MNKRRKEIFGQINVLCVTRIHINIRKKHGIVTYLNAFRILSDFIVIFTTLKVSGVFLCPLCLFKATICLLLKPIKRWKEKKHQLDFHIILENGSFIFRLLYRNIYFYKYSLLVSLLYLEYIIKSSYKKFERSYCNKCALGIKYGKLQKDNGSSPKFFVAFFLAFLTSLSF